LIPPSVLVRDDDPQMLESLGKLLRRQGYHVHLAPDGQAGLGLLRAHPFQVVLTDLKMPGPREGLRGLQP
jgi:CheY-like chemotaxis protein